MRVGSSATWIGAVVLVGCAVHDQPIAALDAGGSHPDALAAPDRAPGPDDALDGAPVLDVPSDDGAPVTVPDGAFCGAMNITVRSTPPNVLVLLQRSCSMAQHINGTSSPIKWAEALSALSAVTAAYPTQVRFGLLYFPAVGGTCGAIGGASCGQINPQARGGAMIAPALMAAGVAPTGIANCSTTHDSPIGAALEGARAPAGTPTFPDPSRANYVLLISDGEERCLDGAVSSTDESGPLAMRVTALRAPASPVDVRTIVVGFGREINATNLAAMARAGGQPAAGATPYYLADSPGQLLTDLNTIVAATISCTLPLASRPVDASMLQLFVNGGATPLARDPAHANGWDYDAASNSVTLYGTPCADARAGRLLQANLVQTCPGTPPPPPPPACRREGESCTADTECCGLGVLSCAGGTCQVTPG